MENTSIYGSHLKAMEDVMAFVLDKLKQFQAELMVRNGIDPVDHFLTRIKAEESMRDKCRQHGLPETEESALRVIRDAIGLRAVCPFLNDVYAMAEMIEKDPELTITETRDYILQAKANGYRSLHIIVTCSGYFAEIQLRTVSQDTWAALEHLINYKKTVQNQDLMIRELKRCADELASTDMSMQTLRDMIEEEEGA